MKIFLITEIKAVKVDVFDWSKGSAANSRPSVDTPLIKTHAHILSIAIAKAKRNGEMMFG